MKFLKLLPLVLILAMNSGCKQDFDITATYKEIPIVYGLLNHAENVHYIRIQKGFLIDGDANVAALNPDSIYYGNELIVYIKTLPNGPVYNLQRVDGRDFGLFKDSTRIVNGQVVPAPFAHEPNILYRFTGTLDQSKRFRLVINNTSSLKVDSAEIGLVRDFTVSTPVKAQKIALQDASPSRAIWYTAVNGAVYDLTIRFPYIEYRIADNSFVRSTTIDIPILRAFEGENNDGSQQINNEIGAAYVLRYLTNRLEKDPSIYRVFNSTVGMKFIYAVGGQDLSNYIKVAQAQSGIGSNDALPPYTNIAGGYGIFSSRYFKQVDSVLLNNNALDSLACSNTMRGCNFKGSAGQICN
jgi:hypothetical protein